MSKYRICAILAVASGMMASPAFAGSMIGDLGANVSPVIVAGGPPDSPANRIDPNLPSSIYSGVVSINIRYNGLSFICSGALIDRTHVLTAGHCVDTDGQGSVIDISQAGNDVRAVFNAQPNVGDPGRAIITASKVTMHPDYKGFGNCPVGVPGFCVNDDIAIIELNQEAPAMAAHYSVHFGAVPEGSIFDMVGYGTSGDGINGYNVGPNFRIKRKGANVYDLTDLDDEENFAGGGAEVWYSDFDGGGFDTFCVEFGVCGGSLGNDIETVLGGGDSGGPSFMWFNGKLQLVGNNTFGWTFRNPAGAFGNASGGMLLASYFDWIRDNSDTVPEPGTLGLGLLGLAGLGLARRRKRIA